MDLSNRNKAIIKNTIIMYIRMLILLFLSLFTARIVFNALGEVNYGIYNVVGGIIVFFSFLNSGLSNATRKYVTSEIASGTDKSRRIVFNTCVMSHIAISGIVLVLAETIGIWFVNSCLNIPEDRYFAANIVYQFSVLTAILGIMQTPFQAVIIAYEKLSIYAYFTIFDVIFKIIIIFCMQYCDIDKLILYTILMFLTSCINIFAYRIYCYKNFPLCKWLYIKNKKIFKDIFVFTGWSLFGQAAVVATNQGVSVLVNIYLTVIANAAMGISNTIINVVNGFVTNFQTAFNPQITKSYAAKDYEYLNTLILRTSKISSYLLLIMSIPIFFECENLLKIWLGQYPTFAPEFCKISLGYIYLEAISAPFWMLIYSDNRIKKYQILISSVYFLNIILSWIALASGFQAYSVMIVRVFVNIIIVIIRMIYCKFFLPNLQLNKWFIDIVIKGGVLIIITSIFTYLLKNSIHFTAPIYEIIVISAFSLIVSVIIIYTICIEERERIMIKQIIKKKINRK